MAAIFISYATKDRERVAPLVDALKTAGFSVWWDRRIDVGTSFDREIERELEAASCVVVVWSHASIESEWVREEAFDGLNRNILVPVQIDDCKLPIGFRRAQTASLIGWPGTSGNVEQLLRRIRELVGDEASSSQSLPADPATRANSRAKDRSIAVLPFTNMSADAENEYFSDGVTEDIITQLCQMDDLKVISRTSVMQFKERKNVPLKDIAGELRVGFILEGSVRRAGDRVRIVAQLIETESDRHLWAETYDRHLNDIFAIQSDVATNIAAALQTHLASSDRTRLAKVPTQNMDAHGLWLRGRSALAEYNLQSVQKSVAWFQRAVELDPDYPHPYVGLADAYIHLGAFLDDLGNPGGYRTLANEAARHALTLDNEFPEALTSLAIVQGWFDWNFTEAVTSFLRSLTLNGNYAWGRTGYASVLTAQGRPDESMAQMDHARELDPVSLEVLRATGFLAYQNRRFDQAIDNLNRLLALEPDFVPALLTLPLVLAESGEPEKGIEVARRATNLTDRNPTAWGITAYAQARAGLEDDARETIAMIERDSGRAPRAKYILGPAYAALGDVARGIESLAEAFEVREPYLMYLNVSPLFDVLRDDAQFQQWAHLLNRDPVQN